MSCRWPVLPMRPSPRDGGRVIAIHPKLGWCGKEPPDPWAPGAAPAMPRGCAHASGHLASERRVGEWQDGYCEAGPTCVGLTFRTPAGLTPRGQGPFKTSKEGSVDGQPDQLELEIAGGRSRSLSTDGQTHRPPASPLDNTSRSTSHEAFSLSQWTESRVLCRARPLAGPHLPSCGPGSTDATDPTLTQRGRFWPGHKPALPTPIPWVGAHP